MPTTWRLLLAPFLFLTFSVQDAGQDPRPPAPADLAIVHATVIDTQAASADQARIEDQTVVMRDGWILEVGPSAAVSLPEGCRVLDGSGKYLVPGFWDMHVHTNIRQPMAARVVLPLLAANGITGVRDMAGDSWEEGGSRAPISEIRKLSRSLEAEEIFGPRLMAISSAIVRGPRVDSGYPRVHPEFWQPRNREQGEQLAEYLKERGVDLIKTYNSIPREAFLGLTRAARRLGLDVGGHLPRGVSPQEAAAAGMRSIEHARFPALACGDGYEEWREQYDAWARGEGQDPDEASRRLQQGMIESFDEVLAEEICFALADGGTTLVPTHTTREMDARADEPEYRADPRRKYIPAIGLANWDADLDNLAASPPEVREFYRQFYELGLRVTGIAHRAGVRVLVGTDTPDTQCFPGFSYHDEMKHLVQAGLTPFEVVRAATLRAAEFLRAEARFGSITKGKAADLLVLDADPTVSIDNSRKIGALILRGRLFDRGQLDQKIQAVAAFAADPSR